jgi:hypothetical protein
MDKLFLFSSIEGPQASKKVVPVNVKIGSCNLCFIDIDWIKIMFGR